MQPIDHTQLMQKLSADYEHYSPKSAALNRRATQVMVDGGSHTLRLIQPFPPRIVAAKGARITDEDGHTILCLWQGHYSNLLGYNPAVVRTALLNALASGSGLQTGMTDRLQIETAELICRQTNSERVRFTTSGALATMQAILLARAFTNREWVIKVGGGWHGAHPWGLKGVHYAGGANPWTVESKGIPLGVTEQIVVTRYNDANMLREHFKQYGDQLACLIVEPFMGSGGFMPARSEFLRAARELADQYGVVLIFDEIISGFRFRAGNLSAQFGVQPDLATFAKIMGGGMPVAAVAGRADIMKLCGRDGGNQVSFPGGTYSAHPAALLAAKTLIEYLVEHEQEIYPRLARLGAAARRTVEKAFADEGIYVRCTGCNDDVVRDSSFAVPQFLRQEGSPIDSPDDVNDPARSDVTLREKVIRLALLLEDVHIVHGGGAISTAHTEQDIAFWGEACRRAARRIQAYQAN